MSYLSYRNELNRISEELEIYKGNNLLNIPNPGVRDISALDDGLYELIEDLADFARSKANIAFSSKLNSINEIKVSVYSGTASNELANKLTRTNRAFQNYAPAESVDEEGAFLVENKNEKSLEADGKNIFVVHGHDEVVLQKVVRLLEKFDLKPIVLREEPNKGSTVIEKFERNALNVGFAVVLMTADDKGATLEDAIHTEYRYRARQNVIMELGFFMAHLKRNRVCVLKTPGVEEPSDILGVVYEEIDSGDAWRLRLCQELKSAGYEVDLNLLYN